jgi:hypothetical protein
MLPLALDDWIVTPSRVPRRGQAVVGSRRDPRYDAAVAMLYRTPILIKRRQPFVDWLRSTEGGDMFEGAEGTRLLDEIDVYLLHVPEQDPALEEMIAEYWPDIFEEQLWAWMTDELTWPADRTREMFDAWFDVQLGAAVEDLVPEEPLTEDDLDAVDLQACMAECAWCGAELDPPGGGRIAGFAIERPERLAHRAGRTLSVVVNRDRTVVGIVAPLDSEAAAAGQHVVFRTCSRDCDRALKATAPRALRKALQSIPDVH